MFSSIEFEFPYILVLIPIFILCSIYCKAKSPSYLIPHLHIFNKAAQKTSFLTSTLKYLVGIFSIIALASPIRVDETQNIKNEGINIVLNLDASASMKRVDLDNSKSRFEVVKEIVNDFIEKRVMDNIAFVLFGDSALLASPLSFDKQSQKEILKYLEVESLGKQTALIDSVAISANILKNKDVKSNVIILLSDGEDTASKIPLDVIIRMLKKYQIKAYTISIGSSNQYVMSKIAKESKGRFYEVYSKEQLSEVYENINQLEKSEITQNRIIKKDYLFFYPLFLAIISLIIYIFIKNKE